MGVKRKIEKRIYKEYLTKYAVKIKCCYCLSYETCPYRGDKEALERRGITTRCVDTPNRTSKSNNPIEIPSFKQYLRNRAAYLRQSQENPNDRFQRYQ